ncbi:MAG: uracil-DNA glycosylase [Patescibacteria group bacterium]
MTKQKEFDNLKRKMKEDKSLPLRKGATNLVLGEGNLNSAIVFIGEGPGYWEDQKGRPFVGAAGKFLDQLLLSIELPREDVFISNVVCYRPPGNRDPSPEEIGAFQPYIDRLIELISPKVIVTLGRFSMGKFIPGAKISSIHGGPQIVDWKDRKITVVPMYHPAAGLRRGEIKAQIFEDFRKLPEIMSKIDEEENTKEVEQMSLV